MKTYYPEVYINEEVDSFLKRWKKIVIDKNKPIEPIHPKIPDKVNFPTFEIIGLIFFLVLITTFENGRFYFLLALLFFSLALYVNIKDRIKYPSLLKDYQNKLNIYLEEKEKFPDKFQQFESNIKSFEFLSNLKHTEFKSLIAEAKPATIIFSNPIVGKSETKFYLYLIKWFTDTVMQNRVIEIFNYEKEINIKEADFTFKMDVENANVPDFYFKHPTFNLNIDIEIDEPYLAESFKPIHYLGNPLDVKRNKYFVQKKWIVIRFSEEQIFLTPDSCCREIAELIYDYTGDALYIFKMINIPRLERFKKWDYNDCINLSKINGRNSYNPFLNKKEILIESLFTIWDTSEKRLIIKDECILYFKKQTDDKKTWVKKEGSFSLINDNIGRMILNINWNQDFIEELIIESLTSTNLMLTNIHSRYTYSYNSTNEPDYTRETYNIIKIKDKLGLKVLNMQRQFEKNGNVTPWVSHWDKEKRVRVTMHEIVMKKIAENKNIGNLTLTKHIILKNKQVGEYIRYFVSIKSNK